MLVFSFLIRERDREIYILDVAYIINNLISVVVSRAENETSTSTSRRKISTEVKLVLADNFDRCNFPSNKTLSRHNFPGHKELDAVITRFGLKRT